MVYPANELLTFMSVIFCSMMALMAAALAEWWEPPLFFPEIFADVTEELVALVFTFIPVAKSKLSTR